MNDEERAVVLYRLKRAAESLDEAELMAGAEHWNTSVNRLYYACFYAVSALLRCDGALVSKHSGVRARFGRDYIKTGVFPVAHGAIFNRLFDSRNECDYSDLVETDPDDIKRWLAAAKALVSDVTEHVKIAIG